MSLLRFLGNLLGGEEVGKIWSGEAPSVDDKEISYLKEEKRLAGNVQVEFITDHNEDLEAVYEARKKYREKIQQAYSEGYLTPDELKKMGYARLYEMGRAVDLAEKRKELKIDKLRTQCEGYLDEDERIKLETGFLSLEDAIVLAEQRRHVEEQKTEDRKNNLARNLQSCAGILLLDTCVWENAEYSDLFDTLQSMCVEQNRKISILREVYLEIINHGNTEDAEAQARSRAAKRFIERLITNDCVNIEDDAISNTEKHNQVYADPAMLKFALTCAEKGSECTIITDDRDLRIRIKSQLNKIKSSSVKIYSVDDLYQSQLK